MRAALNALPMGVAILAADAHDFWQNRATYGLFDAGSSEQKQFFDTVRSLLNEALHGRTRKELVDFDEPHHRTLEIRTVSLFNGGALALIDDQTERARIDRVRTDFVSNISHELKTPVGALSVLAETISSEATSEVMARLAERMVSESQRVSRTIDDLLELARIEFAGLQSPEDVEVGAVCRESIARIQPFADGKHLSLLFVPFNREVHVRGDRKQLLSAVANLVENAVKYSDAHSDVSITLDVADSRALIHVADRGAGISAEHLDRIFERFYRVDDARSRETGGTGLGLAIVRHIAENHGGEVSVQSVEGGGSIFTLALPLQDGGE
jgi:two-component system sensor histidine kinase SenX3